MDNIRDMVVQIAGATEEQMYTVKGVEDATRNIHVAAEQLLVDSCENCENCECLEQDAHQMREDVSKFIV
jgi:methyl-accepting chemotaxis protein